MNCLQNAPTLLIKIIFNTIRGPNNAFKKQEYDRIKKEINKHYTFMSYISFVNKTIGKIDSNGKRQIIGEKINNLNNNLIIIDEVHNITNTDTMEAMLYILTKSKNTKLLILSATPMIDSSSEIFQITQLLNAHKTKLDKPIYNDELVKLDFISKQKDIFTITQKGKDFLTKKLKGKISYVSIDTKTYPTTFDIGDSLSDKQNSLKVINCNMSKFQSEGYTIALEQDNDAFFKNSSDAATIVYPDGSFGSKGFKQQSNFSFLHMNSIKQYSCKLHNILLNLENNHNSIAFIYSSYVNNAGTALIAKTLLQNGYSKFPNGKDFKRFIILDSNITAEKKDILRKKLNHPDNKNGKFISIIIGSPVVSEGVTFKNIRQIDILEPAWNYSRIVQIIGRGVRNNSHLVLPPKERNVSIYKYMALSNENQGSQLNFDIDQVKYQIAELKDKNIKSIERLLKSIAIDCPLLRDINVLPDNFNNSRSCDYTLCNYSCMATNRNIIVDKTTNNKDTRQEFIKSIQNKIIDLFLNYYYLTYSDILNKILNNDHQHEKSLQDALDNIVSQQVILNHKNSGRGTIMYTSTKLENKIIGVYFFNPIDSDPQSSLYENITFNSKSKQEKITLDDYMNLLNIQQPIEPKQPQQNIILKELDAPIYGSLLNRYGNNDGKLRIIDKRNIKNIKGNKSKNITGIVCSSLSLTQLTELIDHFKISTNKKSKNLYCEKLKNYLKNKDLLIEGK